MKGRTATEWGGGEKVVVAVWWRVPVRQMVAATASKMSAAVIVSARLRVARDAPAGNASVGAAPGSTASAASRTLPINRYPLRGTVSTYRGVSAVSPSAARNFLTAVFSPVSKSTTVFGHSFEISCSRVTTWPGLSSREARTCRGCSWRRVRVPARSSSPDCRSSVQSSKRNIGPVKGVIARSALNQRQIRPGTWSLRLRPVNLQARHGATCNRVSGF
jgi:hypothetical protein